MSTGPAGHALYGDDGRVHICIMEGRFHVCPEDLGTLFFVGDEVPLVKEGPIPQVYQLSGTVGFGPSGQAVIIALGSQRYMAPRNRFLAVALGSESSCDLFELPGENTDVGIISPDRERALS